MKTRRLFLALVVVIVASVGAFAQTPPPAPPLVIVVNAGVPVKALSPEDLRNLYLGKQSFWSDNTAVKPLDRPVDQLAGQSFYRDILKMVPARFRHHWQGRQLAGRGIAPEVVMLSTEVIAKVAATAGAVSYLHTSEVPKEPPKGVLLIVVTAEK